MHKFLAITLNIVDQTKVILGHHKQYVWYVQVKDYHIF